MTDEKAKRTWGDWYLIVIGSAVAFCFVLVMLGKVRLINDPFPPVTKQPERPRFDNKECLSRNAYRIREADPLISDEMLSGDVARACVLERREFEGW
jgi:hypothetical protein